MCVPPWRRRGALRRPCCSPGYPARFQNASRSDRKSLALLQGFFGDIGEYVSSIQRDIGLGDGARDGETRAGGPPARPLAWWRARVRSGSFVCRRYPNTSSDWPAPSRTSASSHRSAADHVGLAKTCVLLLHIKGRLRIGRRAALGQHRLRHTQTGIDTGQGRIVRARGLDQTVELGIAESGPPAVADRRARLRA